MFALIIGIVFVGIGVFAIIPLYGIWGFLWTFLAVFIILVNGRNVFRKSETSARRFSNEIQTKREPSELSGKNEEESPEDHLAELYMLYNRHLITDEEYQQKRSKILQDISEYHDKKP